MGGLIALATLLFEVSLTRVFAVTLWYHFGFLAISLALVGTTAAAVAVLVARRMMPEEVLQGSRVQRGDAANGETPQVELHSLRPGPKYRTMEEVEAARQLEYLATQVESEQQARREIPQPDGQPARDTVAECAAGEAARQRQQA